MLRVDFSLVRPYDMRMHHKHWWVPLAVAGAKLVGNGIDALAQSSANKTNKEIHQSDNEFNERMQLQNQQWQEQMWNKQNYYNSASQQRERLEAAGLNPYLMMNGGSAGTAGSVGSVSTASASSAPDIQAVKTDLGSVAEAGADAWLNSEQAQQQQSQQTYYKNQSDYVKEQTRAQQINNMYAVTKQEWEVSKLMKETDNQELQNEYQSYLNRLQKVKTEIAEDTQVDERNKSYYDAMNSFYEAEGKSLDNQMKSEELKVLPERLKLQIRNLAAEYYVLVSQQHMNEAAASKYVSEKLLNDAKTAGVKIDNSIASALKDIKIETAGYERDNARYTKEITKEKKRQERINTWNPFHYLQFSVLGTGISGR